MHSRLHLCLSSTAVRARCSRNTACTVACLLAASLVFGCAASEDATEEPPAASTSRPAANPERNAYFGDLHVHTKHSFDAYLFGVRETPDAAYRFAKGEAISHPSGYDIQMQSGALDFQAVTDHAFYLGVIPQAHEEGSPIYDKPLSKEFRDLGVAGGFQRALEAMGTGEINDLDADVAVKVLHPHLANAPNVRKRFELEGVSAVRVKHPNAVTVLDAGTTETGLPFLVMELLAGHTLADEIERRSMLRLSRAVEILGPVCEVLEEAHRVGIIHRDVKPANIMLSDSGRGEVVKVLDFGISKFIDREKQLGLTGDGVAGTPLFMSPEALLGRESTASTDIFSVGVTLFVALAGIPPHGPPAKSPFEQAIRQVNHAPTPLASVRPDLPIEVTQIVMATLARDPQNRPSLAELRETLHRSAEGFAEPVWPPARTVSSAPPRPGFADEATVRVGMQPEAREEPTDPPPERPTAPPEQSGINGRVDESGEVASVVEPSSKTKA